MKAMIGLGLALGIAFVSSAVGQTGYPDKPIRILVGFPPGGPPDTVARELGKKFTEAWGKPVVIENITGAGGNIAADRVAKSAPDGYTLAMTGSSSIVISPSLNAKMPYNPVKDLAPISATASTRIVLVVRSELPVKTVQDLVALARAQPGQFMYGSAGIGSPGHLAAEVFRTSARLDMQHVPYRGIPALLPDLLSGRIAMTFTNQLVVMPLIREGKLRVLAFTSKVRPQNSEIPTMAESGFASFDVTAWIGLMAPAGTPRPIIDKLHRETVKVLSHSEMRRRLDELGTDVIANSPEEFAALIQNEIPIWAKIVKEAGIRLDE